MRATRVIKAQVQKMGREILFTMTHEAVLDQGGGQRLYAGLMDGFVETLNEAGRFAEKVLGNGRGRAGTP
jgi:hypothetical protein